MQCYDAAYNHSGRIIRRRFGELKDGDVFRQGTFIHVKVKDYFRLVTDETPMTIKPINAIRIGVLRKDNHHKCIGKYSFFNDDTEVEYYPNAFLYLRG